MQSIQQQLVGDTNCSHCQTLLGGSTQNSSITSSITYHTRQRTDGLQSASLTHASRDISFQTSQGGSGTRLKHRVSTFDGAEFFYEKLHTDMTQTLHNDNIVYTNVPGNNFRNLVAR